VLRCRSGQHSNERHNQRAKICRLDAIKLATNLRAWLRGERDRMQAVRVLSLQDKASRRLMRDQTAGHARPLR